MSAIKTVYERLNNNDDCQEQTDFNSMKETIRHKVLCIVPVDICSFNTLYDVMLEIAPHWNNLTHNQQQELSQLIMGQYKSQWFINRMDEWRM